MPTPTTSLSSPASTRYRRNSTATTAAVSIDGNLPRFSRRVSTTSSSSSSSISSSSMSTVSSSPLSSSLPPPSGPRSSSSSTTPRGRGTVTGEDAFPVKLHQLLTEANRVGEHDVVGWTDDGTAFTIYQPKVFAETWMKQYFHQTRYKSFQRQCNLYNFVRTTVGKIKGHYSHPLFVRGNPLLSLQIKRDRAPGTALQQAMAAKAANDKVKKAETASPVKAEPVPRSPKRPSSSLTTGGENKEDKSDAHIQSSRKKSKTSASGRTTKKKEDKTGSKSAKKMKKKTKQQQQQQQQKQCVRGESLTVKTPQEGNQMDGQPSQGSPTGIDTMLFERQVFAFDECIPETLLDPLNCFQADEISHLPQSQHSYGLSRRRDLSTSNFDELGHHLGMSFLDETNDTRGIQTSTDSKDTSLTAPSSFENDMSNGIVGCNADNDDGCSVFSISDLAVDESPTIDDINDVGLDSNLNELVADVVDDTLSSVTPETNVDPSDHIGNEIGSGLYNPSTPEYQQNNIYHPPTFRPGFFPPTSPRHFGHYPSCHGTQLPSSSVPHYGHYTPTALHQPPHHHRPLYYPGSPAQAAESFNKAA